MSSITVESAIVYKVHGRYGTRRFFTCDAAIKRLAWEMINARYPESWSETDDQVYRRRLHGRLCRFIKSCWRRQEAEEKP